MQQNDLIGGRYRIVRELGRGGMGVVYEALQEDLRRPVAIKVLRSTAAATADAHERFLREARAAASFSSPHVVQVLDFGTTPTPYLVMELLVGATLAQRHARERLSEREVVTYARQVLLALDKAHARGIIHRDIKPANLLLVDGEGGAWKLLDFGVAKLTHATHALTAEGSMLGTVAYMAPELFTDPSAVNPGIDLYALGVCMFESLAGRRPTTRTDFAGILAELETSGAPPLRSLAPQVSPGLAALIDRAASRDPRMRFDSARTMLSALDDLERRLSGAAPALASGLSTPPGYAGSGLSPAASRSTWPWVVGGAALLLAVGAGVAAGVYEVTNGSSANAGRGNGADANPDVDAGLASTAGAVPNAPLAVPPTASTSKSSGAPTASARAPKADAGTPQPGRGVGKLNTRCTAAEEGNVTNSYLNGGNGTVCAGGVWKCRRSSWSDIHQCGDHCEDVNALACAGCGKPCGAQQTCWTDASKSDAPGVCKECPVGTGLCSSAPSRSCVRFENDGYNCGACGNNCYTSKGPHAACIRGACVALAAPP